MLGPELLQQLQAAWKSCAATSRECLPDSIDQVYALLSPMLLLERQTCAAVFHLGTTAYEWVSPQVEQVLGYAPEEISHAFLLSRTHPEDLPWLLDIEQTLMQAMGDFSFSERMYYKARYALRLRHADGRYVRIQYQVMALEQDASGIPVRLLLLLSDISYLMQEGSPVLSLLPLREGLAAYVDYPIRQQHVHGAGLRHPLDHQERQLLKYFIRGDSSSKIAQQLSMSRVNVERQRRSLFQKMQVHTTDELCMITLRHGWL